MASGTGSHNRRNGRVFGFAESRPQKQADRQGCGLEMKMTSYIGLIDGKAGAYGVYFPDLPGCTAMGATIDEAAANAAKAMRDWVDVTEQKGGAIPAPRAMESLCEDTDASEMLGEGAPIVHVELVRATDPR